MPITGASKKDTRSLPPRSNWALIQRKASIYALSIVDLSTPNGPRTQATRLMAQTNLPGMDIASSTFVFSVSPKSMNMDEPAAVTIVPTPGGQFVEHQGQIYKNIAISGTTGLRPNRGQTPITQITGLLLPGNAQDNIGLGPGERSGFDDFISLRNLFRHYWDLKDDPDRAPTTIMVWQNGKEGEYYIVEPMTFRTNRDASSPLTFSYDIQLRTIDVFSATLIARFFDPLRVQNDVQLYTKRLGDYRRSLSAAVVTAQALQARVVGIPQGTINLVMTPVSRVIDSLASVSVAGRQAFPIPQTTLATVASSATDLATELDNVANNTFTTNGIIGQAATASNAYRTMARQLLRLATEDRLFATQVASTVSVKRATYASTINGLPITGGSPTDLGNVQVAAGAASTVIYDGEDIRGVARRVLGDAAQWKILVLLNALQQPYISPAGDGSSVLRPGDQILYPRAPGSPEPFVAPTTQRVVGTMSALDRYGRDFRLESRTATAGEVIYDVAKDQRGDIARVERVENLQQAVRIKLDTEQNELPTHPWFGLRAPIGTKAQRQSLITFQINVRATILSDNRFEAVTQLNIGVEGNILRVNADVLARDFDEALSVNHAVQR